MNLMKLIINSITELIHLLLYSTSFLVSIIPIILLCLPYQIGIQTFRLISEYLTIILTKFTEYIIIFHEIKINEFI